MLFFVFEFFHSVCRVCFTCMLLLYKMYVLGVHVYGECSCMFCIVFAMLSKVLSSAENQLLSFIIFLYVCVCAYMHIVYGVCSSCAHDVCDVCSYDCLCMSVYVTVTDWVMNVF